MRGETLVQKSRLISAQRERTRAMKDLRENRFSQQTIARRVNEWSEAPALTIETPGARDYLSGFVRAIVQTLSPSSVRSFFRELDATDPDRKSTRLNSSHGYISYAVFSLKI